MPRFEPFRALRYSTKVSLDKTIAPPYDVLSERDVNELRDMDEHNIVWIDVPDGGDDRYQIAAFRLGEWQRDGVLVRDDHPSFTIYRMKFVDAAGKQREISGVLGGIEVVDEKAGGVLAHERTTKKAKSDRLDLTRATAANLSPAWGLSLASGLTDVLAEPGLPVGCVEVEGVQHIVEKVDDPKRVAKISRMVESADVLIADGHHRYAISREYRDEIRKATRSKSTEAECTLMFVNELVEDQLAIEAIHRLYDGVSFRQLKEDLSGCFEFEKFDQKLTPQTLTDMETSGRLVLISPHGRPTWLKPRPGAFLGVRDLDGAWLEHALAGSLAKVSYQHGLKEVLNEVSHHAAAILVRPTSLAEIRRTAEERLLMPPKSTFFTPKLRTGFVIRPTAKLPD
uniref:DUF1015 family protein n=1 Tax=Vaginimicrobium propionicum TaxID=1871034 RepID=UPI0009705EC1|nr:DUF1015 domain-containing protein [Vaginimicrobium propionicum]